MDTDQLLREMTKYFENLKNQNIATEKAEQMMKDFAKTVGKLMADADRYRMQEEARQNQLQRFAKAQYLLHAKEQSLQKQKNKDIQDQIRLQSRAKSLHNQEMSTRQDDYFRGVRMNKRLSQSNKSFEKSLDLVTGNLFSWFPLLGKGVNQFGRTVKGMSDYNKNMKDYQDQFSRTMSESIKKRGTPDEDRATEAAREAFEELRNYMASPQGVLGKIEIRGKKVADLLEGAKTYFNKHKTGILFGVGAFVGLVAVLKKALEVSPMFQQMVKLLNFGVMMILRPIGDFFGFVMRPILIALMRYFIIPWFRVAYPFYRKWGDRIGRLMSGDLSVIGEIAANAKLEDLAAILGTFGVSGTVLWGLSKLASKLLGIVKPAAAVVNPPVVPSTGGGSGYTGYTGTQQGTNTWKPQGNQGFASGNPVNKSPVGNIIKPTPPPPAQSTGAPVNNQTNKNARKMGDLINKLKVKGINSLKGLGAVGKFLQSNKSTFMRLASIGGKAAGLGAAIFEPIRVGIAAISSTWRNHDPEGWMAMQMATGGIDPDSPVGMIKAFTGFSGFGAGVSAEEAGGQTLAHTNKWNKDKKTPTGFTGYTGNQVNAADVKMANGGIISEPIIGVGKSGRTYSFGEKGSETVIPHGASAGGITINIQNMSGSHNDLQNLRKVIMQVMQESNTARGRI